MTIWRLPSLTLLVLVGGCAVGPAYLTPKVAVPPDYSGPAAAPAADLSVWWTRFEDPVLSDLIARALAENLDVQQAAAKVRQAREQENAVRGQGGPKVNASGQASQTRLSQNSISGLLSDLGSGGSASSGSGSSALGLPGSSFSTFQAGFDASWELDVFGAQRRANEGARARAEAAEWSGRDAQVTLAAEVVRTYQQYRADQRRTALLDETIAAQRDLQEVVRARTGAGLVNDLDERRQQRNLEQLLAQRADLAADAAVSLHALAVLLGQTPETMNQGLAQSPAPIAQDIDVPAGLPSDLLRRRPDIRAAERQLAAATADVGAATADLYPKISLTGAAQLVSRSLSTLLESDSLQLNGAGKVSLPLLDRGVRKSIVRLRQAQADEAALAYRKAVLTALRDVEDALSRLDTDRARAARLKNSCALAQDAAETAQVRYRNGLTGFIDVIEARQAAVSARDALAQARAAVLIDVAALYKALGGGWDATKDQTEQKDVAVGQGR